MNNKVVDSFRVKKKLLGGYKVVYKCPHCNEKLTSQESEIIDEEQCPECGMPFKITDEAVHRIEILRAIEDNDGDASITGSFRAKEKKQKNVDQNHSNKNTIKSSHFFGLKKFGWAELSTESLAVIKIIAAWGVATVIGIIISNNEKEVEKFPISQIEIEASDTPRARENKSILKPKQGSVPIIVET